jgi:hypothetical protein
MFVAREAKENTDAEIEAVEEHIEQYADGQDGYPEGDHDYFPAVE